MTAEEVWWLPARRPCIFSRDRDPWPAVGTAGQPVADGDVVPSSERLVEFPSGGLDSE